jgi:hypothetical protein
MLFAGSVAAHPFTNSTLAAKDVQVRTNADVCFLLEFLTLFRSLRNAGPRVNTVIAPLSGAVLAFTAVVTLSPESAIRPKPREARSLKTAFRFNLSMTLELGDLWRSGTTY